MKSRPNTGLELHARVRYYVQAVLDAHGFRNKFTVRTVDFTDLMRSSVLDVSIKNWKPNPKAKSIKEAIYKKFPKGVTVSFD